MPTELSWHLAMVWSVLGLCTGAGWALGWWIVGRVTR